MCDISNSVKLMVISCSEISMLAVAHDWHTDIVLTIILYSISLKQVLINQ